MKENPDTTLELSTPKKEHESDALKDYDDQSDFLLSLA
jgi:hypothetical protein